MGDDRVDVVTKLNNVAVSMRERCKKNLGSVLLEQRRHK